MLSVNCPTCGAPVTFKLESSLYSTCEHCHSVLLRQDMDIQSIGTASCVHSDTSPLQIGTSGTFKGVGFEILGRTQAIQSDGFWNEWFIAFNDGRTGWLSESIGEYCITIQQTPKKPLPNYDKVKIGTVLQYGGTSYMVTNKGKAQVVAFEGELNFNPRGSYDLYYLDLRSYSGKAGTIDYSDVFAGEGAPELFLGEYLDFKEFNFRNLRDDEERLRILSAPARTFQCPCCGAAHEVQSGQLARSYVCEYCGSCSDISNNNVQLLFQYETRMAKNALRIPLGATATFDNTTWTVIGAQKKYSQDEGLKEYWEEYLLYDNSQGQFLYLEYNSGSWSINHIVHSLPSKNGRESSLLPLLNIKGAAYFGGTWYKHYAAYVGHVESVIGEFPYLVVKDEVSKMTDYIAPPYGLCSERNDEGVFWSQSEYKSREEIAAAFKKPELAENVSDTIGMLEPNPFKAPMRNTLIHFCLVSLIMLITIIAISCQEKNLSSFSAVVYEGKDSTFITDEFDVPGRYGSLALRGTFGCGYDTAWVEFNTTLINVNTNEARVVEATAEKWYEDGERGSTPATVIIPNVPAGRYCLRIVPALGIGNSETGKIYKENPTLKNVKTNPVFSYAIKVSRNAPFWSFFLILEVLLAILPIYYTVRYQNNETARWANSDHADDDDDD
ncbi:MAG: DUF4178 domain-containing protein [Candidatus Bruticola sp.]